jgi:Flp pilus assembly protein TadD
VRSWIGRVFLVFCMTAMACATAPHRETIDDAVLHFNQGLGLQQKGDLDGAIAEYRTALRLDPNQVAAHYNLGVALRGKGDKEEATRELQDYIRLAPETPATRESKNHARQLLKELE